MGDISIPPSTTPPTNTEDPNYEAALLAYKKKEGNRSLLIQTLMEQQSQDQATRSNMQKASHDALMAIANNMKS